MSEISPLPFMAAQESGGEPLSGATAVAMNVVVDRHGAIRRRPGVLRYGTAPITVHDPIVGLHAVDGKPIVAIRGAPPGVYDVLSVTESSILPVPGGASLSGTGRPVFAETEAMVIWANGGPIKRILNSEGVVGTLGGDPPLSTHIVAQSLRLLANEAATNRTNINYSGVASGGATIGHEEWNEGIGASQSTSGFFSAEADPGPVLALAGNSSEVIAFKRKVTQSFVPDATDVYSRVTTREFGIAAAYSVIVDDQSFAWLDDRRRIVHSDLRQVTPLSDPIQATLDDMDRVDDAYGFRIKHGAVDALVWTFPTDGRTFAYQKDGGWSQWMGWNATNNTWKPWGVTAHHHVSGENLNLVGTSNGEFGIVRHDHPTDLGEPIRAFIQTGFLNHGSDLRKRCIGVRLTFRRGHVLAPGTPVAGLSWRDDEGSWQGPIDISLGRSGESAPVVSFRGMGVYRRRQWKLSFFEGIDFVLAGAEEEFEVLSS